MILVGSQLTPYSVQPSHLAMSSSQQASWIAHEHASSASPQLKNRIHSASIREHACALPEETACATAVAVAVAVADVGAEGAPTFAPADAEAPAIAPAGVHICLDLMIRPL